jgi:hypothetical protein
MSSQKLFGISDENFVGISYLSNKGCMSLPPYPSSYNIPDNLSWWVQIMKLLTR